MYSFLFVDDEPLMRDFFAEVLDFSEFDFRLEAMFSSAEQALDYVQKHPEISAVLTDIRMGDMSGIDFCENVRKTNKDILLVVF